MRMKKRYFEIILTLILIGIIVGFAYVVFQGKKYGNTEGNIANNYTRITKDEEYTYICLYTGLYRGKDIHSLEKIAEGDYSYVNSIDDWIYVQHWEDLKNTQIIKMAKDGTEKETLYAGDAVNGPWVINSHIYFEKHVEGF